MGWRKGQHCKGTVKDRPLLGVYHFSEVWGTERQLGELSKEGKAIISKDCFWEAVPSTHSKWFIFIFFGMWRTVQAPPAGKKCWCPLLFLTGIAVWLKRAMGESEHLEYFHFYITSSLIILFCTFSHSWFCSMLLRPPSPRLNTIQ